MKNEGNLPENSLFVAELLKNVNSVSGVKYYWKIKIILPKRDSEKTNLTEVR